MIQIAESIKESLERLFAGVVIQGQELQFCLVGNPPVIPRYPAITVELLGNENLPLALGVFTQEHRVRITVWTNAESYLRSYLARSQMATMIETSLFRNVYPVIKPYCWSNLAQYLMMGDTQVVVSDPSVFSYPYPEPLPVYLDNGLARYPNALLSQDGATFDLEREAPIDFALETGTVIRPLIHAYDCLVESVDYGEGRENELMLLHATLIYRLKIARLRYSEPYQTSQ